VSAIVRRFLVSAFAARLLVRLVVIAMLVGMLPPAALSAAPEEGDAAAIWACKQQNHATLRPVADQADCGKNERAVNLNDTKNPVGVCVGNDDQVLRLARADKGGSRPGDCDRRKETFRELPGDTPVPLCTRWDDRLAICGDSGKSEETEPPRNQKADKGDNGGDESKAGTDAAAEEQPKEQAAKPNRKSSRNHKAHKGDDPGAGTDAAAEEPQKPTTDPAAGEEPEERATDLPTGQETEEPATGPDRRPTRAPKKGNATPVWACEQPQGGTLRLVADRADCAKNEHEVNLNNRQHPVGVCVTNSDHLLRLNHPAKKGGSGSGDCKGQTETFLKLPGDSEAKLCVRSDGFLVLCSDNPNPDVPVPARNQQPVAGDDAGAGFGTDEDTAFTTGSVLGNDSDGDDDKLSVALINLGIKGKVTSKGDGTFAYNPNGKFEALAVNETATD
jgi:hypothetical protein